MLPCKCVVYWAAWLYSPCLQWSCIQHCKTQKWCRNSDRWWNAGFKKSVTAKGKCLYFFIKLSWLFTSVIPSSHTLHLWSWCCLGNTCMGLKSAVYRILEAWGDCCHQPAGQWHYSDQKAWSSVVLHFRKQGDWSYKSAEGLTAMNLERLANSGNVSYFSICSYRLHFQLSLVNLISSGFFFFVMLFALQGSD